MARALTEHQKAVQEMERLISRASKEYGINIEIPTLFRWTTKQLRYIKARGAKYVAARYGQAVKTKGGLSVAPREAVNLREAIKRAERQAKKRGEAPHAVRTAADLSVKTREGLRAYVAGAKKRGRPDYNQKRNENIIQQYLYGNGSNYRDTSNLTSGLAGLRDANPRAYDAIVAKIKELGPERAAEILAKAIASNKDYKQKLFYQDEYGYDEERIAWNLELWGLDPNEFIGEGTET